MDFTTTMRDWPILKSLDSTFLETIKMISVSIDDYGHCALLVTHSGELYAVGKSIKGCLGLGDVTETKEPCQLQGITGVAGVSVCGLYGEALAYTKEGKVYAWGKNVQKPPCNRPTVITDLIDIVDARCVYGHYLALYKTGKVYEWKGVSSYMPAEVSTTPRLQCIEEVVVAIACGFNHSLALTENGVVYQWGFILCHNDYVNKPMSVNIPGETVVKVACNLFQSLVLTKTGKIFTWGENHHDLGDLSSCTSSEIPVQVGKDIISRFVDIGVNTWQTCGAVTEAGAVYMWGEGGNDKSVGKSKLTAFKELHQVFAKSIYTRFSWTCASNDKITIDSTEEKSNKEIFERLKTDHAKVQRDLSKLEKDHNKLEEDYAKLEKDHTKLKNDYEKGHAKLKNDYEKDHAELEKDRENLEKDHERRFEKIEEEFDKLRTLLVHSEESRLKHEDLVTAQVNLRKLEFEYEKQQEKLEKVEKEQKQLEKLSVIVEHKGQLAELDRLKRVEVDYAKLQVENEKLRSTMIENNVTAQVNMRRLELEYEEQQRKLEKIEKEQLEKELDRLRGVEVDYAKLQMENEQLRTTMIENNVTAQVNMRRLEFEYEEQQRKLEKIEKEREQLEKELDRLRGVEVDYAKLQMENEQLRTTMVENNVTAQVNMRRLELEYEEQQRKLEKIGKEPEQLEKELDRLRGVEVDYAKLQMENEKLRTTMVENIKQQGEQQQGKLHKLEKENRDQQEELEWLRSILLHQKEA